MRVLQALEQVQPAAGQRVGGQDGGGGRFGIEHGARVTQQAVEVILAEGLAGQAGDAFVVRHHVAAQRVGDGLAVAAGHHAAAVSSHAWAPGLPRAGAGNSLAR
ncbi:hypothetical protein G6F57_017627 [Rhizopus arrhizus]|nr:hypothetical protein G6F57_017627 [Rhizopus arrhizus]